MEVIDLYARLIDRPIDTDHYQWIKFAPHVYGGKYPRNTTKWEQECLDTVNQFLEKLFSVPGFTRFFTDHHCILRKEQINAFISDAGFDFSFPESREYREPFRWDWCQYEGGQFAQGHIMDFNGWFYDKAAIPDLVITLDHTEYQPFRDIRFFDTCVENYFAWNLCEACAYQIPELYAYIRYYDHNIENMYEGAFDIQEEPLLQRVLAYLDEQILPTYNIIVSESTPIANAGNYPRHFFDWEDINALKDLIRKHKKEIKAVIEATNK